MGKHATVRAELRLGTTWRVGEGRPVTYSWADVTKPSAWRLAASLGGNLAANEELATFVKDALLRGLPREQIRAVLLQAGWRAEQISGALACYAQADFPIPVPMPKPYLSARDAFMYLLLFTTLYISAFDLINIAFQWIDHAFPDGSAARLLHGDAAFLAGIRWPVASLVIALPIYLLMTALLRRAVARDSSKRASKVRKWLTYATLFSACLALIGDCTSLVANLLGGELTVRFVLKIATIAVIAGAVFTYYLRDLRGEEAEAQR